MGHQVNPPTSRSPLAWRGGGGGMGGGTRAKPARPPRHLAAQGYQSKGDAWDHLSGRCRRQPTEAEAEDTTFSTSVFYLSAPRCSMDNLSYDCGCELFLPLSAAIPKQGTWHLRMMLNLNYVMKG